MLRAARESATGDGGLYSASYTLPTSGTVTGTYVWTATYSGDGNNLTATDTDTSSETTVVSSAVATVTTTASPTSVTLGTTGVVLSDTADLEGAYSPTGSVTFTLSYNGSAGCHADGIGQRRRRLYSASYTLPTSGTATGTYVWTATYSGDGNNLTATDTDTSSETTVVSSAVATVTTTASPTSVTLGTTGVVLSDTADLEGAYFADRVGHLHAEL